MTSFERIVTHPATAMVAQEVIEQPNVNLESLKQDPRTGQLLVTGRKRFWGEAALTVVYLINRIPSSVLNNQSPYERLHGILPAYNLLKVMGLHKKDIVVGILCHKNSEFHVMLSFGNTLCTFDELYNASSHAPTSSVEDDLLAGNTLDSFEPFSTSSSISPIDSTNELVVLSSSHLTRASSNPFWQQAMQDELQALENTRTWDLVDLHAEKSLMGCKWVYKIKTRSDGSVECYKALLVAKGFTQEYGINYEETFAPVAHLTSMHSLLAIVAMQRWKLFQMDVKNAFLNGDIEEEVYMKPPPGLNHPLNKTARGMVLLLLYVDDMIIIGDDVTVTSSDDGYLLSQVKYAFDLVSKDELNDGKSVSTPLELNIKLTPMDGSSLSNPTRYWQLVGSLVYLITTHPDIAYAVHIVSQFMATPHSTHYAAVLRIIRYVKGTLFHGLHFSANFSPVLRSYSNANWASNPSDRRSTTCYYLFLGNSLISWRSNKQAIPSCSSTEAEYRALGDTTSELLSL
ncbi:hypothetical protein SLEP1_g30132 [Rubroshorea leprosula]|uniref:Reverse transcriptase Ty1/copia-type domain-containing protein n=1 Tax=Rubroshorea leprosula TaxID=152421 RepID=A0AAV5K5F1_9ROSI|nr:hypothetical protein SLEP1_g30132 [Rubroshorea leprosula]